MRALFYDTETTGLPLFREPSEDPRQPHIVQLAASMVDLDTRAVLASIDLIVRPNGWEIPAEVAAIHGITTERALDEGVDEKLALNIFHQLWERCGTRVAHNEDFDARIIRIGLLRHIVPAMGESLADAWKAAPSECTVKLSTGIMQLPPTEKMKAAGRFHHKTPNLAEAYRFFTGRELENAHSARADVDACLAVYWAIKDGVREAIAA